MIQIPHSSIVTIEFIKKEKRKKKKKEAVQLCIRRMACHDHST